MKFSPQILVVLVLVALCASSFAVDKPTSPGVPAASESSVLPAEFSGWQVKGSITKSDDPAAADAANAPVLKEYGFQHLERAAYTRDDGRNLTIKAAVFADASGAYGAFTYYYSEDMGEETIGAQAAFQNNRVLFYQGNVLVDATFDRMSVMSASQLRQLAGLLPQAEGNKGNPPSLPTHLPKTSGKNLKKNTTKYILGPVALDRLGSPCPRRWWISIGGGSRAGQICGQRRRRDSDAHRISDAADCRGTSAPD